MALYTKSKTSLDFSNRESWKYTVTNNVKKFSHRQEAKNFIISTCRIWSLMTFPNGQVFVDHVLESIDRTHESCASGFNYIDNKGDICHILFLIKILPDGKTIQVSHTHQKLSRSGAYKHAADTVEIEECNVMQWLEQRACDELKVPKGASITSMLDKAATSQHHAVKYSYDEYDLGDNDIKAIEKLNDSKCTLGGFQYHTIDRYQNGQFIQQPPTIVEKFCDYLSQPQEFLEKFVQRLQSIQQPKQMLHGIEFQDGSEIILSVAVLPTSKMLRLYLQSQWYSSSNIRNAARKAPMDCST